MKGVCGKHRGHWFVYKRIITLDGISIIFNYVTFIYQHNVSYRMVGVDIPNFQE